MTNSGTGTTMWGRSPDSGRLQLQQEISSEKQLIFSVINSGESVSIVNKIELTFSNRIPFYYVYQPIQLLKEGSPDIKNYTIKTILRSPHVPNNFPEIDDNGTLYIGNARGHLDISPIDNSCDAISGDLPCYVPPNSSITIDLNLYRNEPRGISRHSSLYDIPSSLKPDGDMSLYVFFDDDQKSCLSEFNF